MPPCRLNSVTQLPQCDLPLIFQFVLPTRYVLHVVTASDNQSFSRLLHDRQQTPLEFLASSSTAQTPGWRLFSYAVGNWKRNRRKS